MSSAVGKWRIVEMDLWDRDAIDLVAPAFVEFTADDRGAFGFIAVEGHLDCRYLERNGLDRVEFTWDGYDDGDHASGRGWAQVTMDGSMVGHIFFHGGDDSKFQAVPVEDSTVMLALNLGHGVL